GDHRRVHPGNGGRGTQDHQDGAQGAGPGAGPRSGGVPEGRRRGQARVPGIEGARGHPTDHPRRKVGISRVWTVYMLRCRDGSLYTGITNDLTRRLTRHNAGTASAYTRARPPVPVDGSLPADSARDRRLVARGVYDYAHERLWHGRSYEGVPGVDLVTPLRLAGGAAVLVDRGWAPSPDAFHVDQPAYREGDSAVVLGLGMLAPRARGDVDPAALRDSIPYRLLPFVVQQLPPSTPPYRPLAPGLIRWP